MRTIDADVLKSAFETDGYLSPYMQRMIDACPTLEVVPMNYHEQCMQLSVNRRIQAEKAVPKWISVEDETPKKWKETDGTLVNYLVFMPEYGVDVGNYLETAKTWVCMGLPVKVTHYMPLPQPPKEDAE